MVEQTTFNRQMSNQSPQIQREDIQYGGLRDEQVERIKSVIQESPDSITYQTIRTRQCNPNRKQFLIIDVEVRSKYTVSFKAGIVPSNNTKEPDMHFLKKSQGEYDGPYSLTELFNEITTLAETIQI